MRCRVLRVTPLLPLPDEAGCLPRLRIHLRPVELPPAPQPAAAAAALDVEPRSAEDDAALLSVGDAVEAQYGTDEDELWWPA